jgi:hypothetical protein
MWMLPHGATVNCSGPGGAPPPDAVVLSAEQWRQLGKPRSLEGHQTAVRRASPALRAALNDLAGSRRG